MNSESVNISHTLFYYHIRRSSMSLPSLDNKEQYGETFKSDSTGSERVIPILCGPKTSLARFEIRGLWVHLFRFTYNGRRTTLSFTERREENMERARVSKTAKSLSEHV
jgi:hypothetical protein